MAELPDVFKSDDHEAMSDFSVMPIDDLYLGEIVRSEIKKTKAGTGLRLNLQIRIMESKNEGDKYRGRIIFIGLNVRNPNTECVTISQKELKSILDAVDVEEIEDSDELHEIPFGMKLGIENGNDGYPDKNKVIKYITEDEYNSTKETEPEAA